MNTLDIIANSYGTDKSSEENRISIEIGSHTIFIKKQPTCRIDIESVNFLNGIIIITKR